MAVAAIFNVPSTPDELNAWSFAHAAHHRDINRVIQRSFNITIPEFVLDPINPEAIEGWAQQHQQMHTQMDAVLGIAGFDLLEVDWKNRNELAGWIYLNAQEHYQASALLQLG